MITSPSLKEERERKTSENSKKIKNEIVQSETRVIKNDDKENKISKKSIWRIVDHINQ